MLTKNISVAWQRHDFISGTTGICSPINICYDKHSDC